MLRRISDLSRNVLTYVEGAVETLMPYFLIPECEGYTTPQSAFSLKGAIYMVPCRHPLEILRSRDAT